jgi:hypothetical protein
VIEPEPFNGIWALELDIHWPLYRPAEIIVYVDDFSCFGLAVGAEKH